MQTSMNKPRKPVYVLSIKLPSDLVKAIDRVARMQFRTKASLIREVLAKHFKVAS